MKKFFIYLLVLCTVINAANVSADVRSIATKPNSMPVSQQARQKNMDNLYKEIPNLNDKTAVSKYLQERLKVAAKADVAADEIGVSSATSVINLKEIEAENNKKATSSYDAIYKNRLNQVGGINDKLNENLEIEGTFHREVIKDNNIKRERIVPDFPYLNIKLSDNREIMVPAEEHLPYVFTSIRVQPTGFLNISEEFVLVSDNVSFPFGFFRILPKYNYSRSGHKRRLDIELESVTINNQEVEYKITEVGNYLYIEPKEKLNLPTGVHTYKFNYLVDRVIYNYDEFDEFYWDITGKTLKNVVGSANAMVSLPSGKSFMAQNAIASTRGGIDEQRVAIHNIEENILGFTDTQALDVGEDIHIYITLEKGTLIAPSFAKRYIWFIHDFGAILFALFALIAIYISYRISLEQILNNKDKISAKIKKTPAVFRYFYENIYDKTSFGAEILSLIAKNIVEIRPQNNSAVLFQKTDNIKNLSRTEKKLLKKLFPETKTSIVASRDNKLQLERVYKSLSREVYRKVQFYKLKLNSAYLGFSLGMLFIGQIGAAMLAVNPLHTFLVIIGCTVMIACFMMLYSHEFKKLYINLSSKVYAIISMLSTVFLLSIYTSKIYALIIGLSIVIIIYYFNLFSKRNGLLRYKIRETMDLKSHLQKNTDIAVTSRDFKNKMPYIYVFELEDKYAQAEEFICLGYFMNLLPNNKG